MTKCYMRRLHQRQWSSIPACGSEGKIGAQGWGWSTTVRQGSGIQRAVQRSKSRRTHSGFPSGSSQCAQTLPFPLLTHAKGQCVFPSPKFPQLCSLCFHYASSPKGVVEAFLWAPKGFRQHLYSNTCCAIMKWSFSVSISPAEMWCS